MGAIRELSEMGHVKQDPQQVMVSGSGLPHLTPSAMPNTALSMWDVERQERKPGRGSQ